MAKGDWPDERDDKDEGAKPEGNAFADEAVQAAKPTPRELREIDRWAVEASAGFLFRTYDAYTDRLGDFGYERDKPFIDLPSGRLALGVSRSLAPHIALVVQGQTLAGDSFARQVDTSTDRLTFKGYGAGFYARVHTDLFPRLIQLYAQAGVGAAYVTSSLATTNASGPYTAGESDWGYLLGIAGGVLAGPEDRVGGFMQVAYDRAPALPNLLGERHDVGGPSVSIGMRVRFGKVWR
jgi:hypothetical protein